MAELNVKVYISQTKREAFNDNFADIFIHIIRILL